MEAVRRASPACADVGSVLHLICYIFVKRMVSAPIPRQGGQRSFLVMVAKKSSRLVSNHSKNEPNNTLVDWRNLSVKFSFALGSGHYLEHGRGWMISGRGYGYLGNAGGGVMEYPQRKKEGLLEINEHFIHSKKYGFITL